MSVLSIKLASSGADVTTYHLQAESATIAYDRGPSAIPVPGGRDPIFMDFGSFSGTISVSGIIDETSSSDGGVTIPSKENLEDKIIDWWNDTLEITVNGDRYAVRIKSARFEVSAATEHFWSYSMNFLAGKRK